MPAFNEADGSHLVDLPTLTTFEGRLEPDGDYDGFDFDGLSLSGQRAHRARLTQSRIHDCDMDEVDLRDALIAECVFELVHAGALNMAGTSWRDVHIQQVRIGSLQVIDSVLTCVTARNTRLDLVNLRAAELTDVRFEQCVITDLDLGSAVARRVSFVGCRIDHVACFQADLEHVDFSRSEVGEFTDVGHLGGVVINTLQLAALAPAMASHLGLSVHDDISPADGGVAREDLHRRAVAERSGWS
jgi:uncharacterized protein YjbI with pentapeptide repeats